MDSLAEIQKYASEWVARRHGMAWTPDDEAELVQWLNASVSHRVEYLCHEKTWREAHRLKVLGAGTKPGVVPTLDDWRASPYFKHMRAFKIPSVSDGPRGPSVRRYFALAASVLVVCAAGYVGWDRLRGDHYSTSTGMTTAVPLPDGSKITLNTDSEIRVALTERQREVDLAQGEAYFEVVRDPTRPFIVKAGEKSIVVLGTKFSVMRQGDDLRVVVTEGRVRIDQVQVAAGGVARTSGASVNVQRQTLPQAEQLLSWREGFLMFDEATLADAVAEFNRYNKYKLVIRDPTIANVRITGHFRSTSVESFASLLEKGFPISVVHENDRIVLAQAR